MKKLLTLLLLLALPAFAGTLVDNANVFGPRGAQVESALAGKPVYIQTVVQAPPDLKAYTDNLAQEHGRGFAVVITTQPRAWRISMNPVGLASSESVRLAGDQMTAYFKRGQFAEGAIGLANELVRLSTPREVVRVSQQTPAAVHVAVKSASLGLDAFETFICVLIGAATLVFLIWGICALVERAQERKKEKARREWEQFNQESEARRLVNRAGLRPMSQVVSKELEAQRVYDSYTPAQRQIISTQYVNHPSYSPGMLNDPLSFYLFMSAINGDGPFRHSYGGGYAPSNYTPPAPMPEPTTVSDDRGSSWSSPAPSYSPPERRSSSDDSGASSSYSPSSSYDSGSSGSSDSGSSSSDSSGGGGSW